MYLSDLKTKFWIAYYPEEGKVPDYWYFDTKQDGDSNTKLQKRIMNKKTDEKETIRHLTCEFKNPYENPMLIKFKSNEIIDTEINKQDRVLITDENYPFMPQEGIVVQKKQKK